MLKRRQKDNTSNTEEDMPVLLQDVDITNMVVDFDNELDCERIQSIIFARCRAAEERVMLQTAAEQTLERNNQIRTYLLASVADENYKQYRVGPFSQICPHCQAMYFRCEQNTRGNYTSCCNNGEVLLPPLGTVPDLLKSLYTNEHRFSDHFQKNILRFNYAFQFASVEANIKEFSSKGPFVYAIQGRVYHHISHVDVNNPQPRYAQMYFVDHDDGVERRHATFEGTLQRELIQELETLLRRVNPYAIGFVNLGERYNIEKEIRDNENVRMPNLVLDFVHVHARNYEMPAVKEIAIVHNADHELKPVNKLRIYLRNRPHKFLEIFSENPLSDPLSFPLLFPLGEQGWHYNMNTTNNHTKVTLADYYRYRFAYRTIPNETFQIFQHSGKLFQQFVVASYVKIESNRLKYILQHQHRFRAEMYSGLTDYLLQGVNLNDVHIGKMAILPSTFIGGPRNMMELLQDSWAIVQKLGHPSLFITFTCNPKWPDIVENIPEGDDPTNHPLLVARVFKLMLRELLDDIDNKQVVGVSTSRIHVIEFQKRGVPHAHILIFLRPEDRLEEAFRIDTFIRAELPNIRTEHQLYNLVCSYNIHGPCDTNSMCMINGKCSKHFPKEFADETTINDNGLITYKRRNDGRIATIKRNGKEFSFDNRSVVPYNAYLTLKYGCHINVEALHSTRAMKYLLKYIWKGADKCIVRVRAHDQLEYNEVNAYLSARYLTPPEASWRILKFALHETTHTVIRLPVHLPLQQIVIFQETNVQQALDRYVHTQLTRWFELNTNDGNARRFLYSEIPLHYVWNSANRNWSARQRNIDRIVTRIYAVSPIQGELYYLRLLLLNVRGPRNWEELRTVNGQLCSNFREACSKLNLLTDDLEWIRCLTEAQETPMPYQIRQMFVYILVLCEVGNPLELWEQFCESMIGDFLHANENLQHEAALQMALEDLERELSAHNKHLSEYNLPQPQVDLLLAEDINIVTEKYDGIIYSDRLNDEQRHIYDTVLRAVRNYQMHNCAPENRLFVVDSAGGTGKSFLFNALISMLSGENIAVLSCCLSGIGATILKWRKTIHSAFKLQLNINESTVSGIRPNSIEGRFIAGVGLIIIDEISMASKIILNIIDKILKDITRNNSYFGGKVILLGGDFRQLLPIIEYGNRAGIVSCCVKNSVHWPLFRRYVLNSNHRTKPGEIEFREWLIQLGNGTLPAFAKNNITDLIRIPDACVVLSTEHLIEVCFGGITPNEHRNVAILTPKIDDCLY